MQLDVLSEFLGTMVLILLGNGVGMSVSYSRMYANQSGKWVVITMGWGFAVLFGVIVSASLGGSGHLNPAVSLFSLISKGITPTQFILYVIAQVAGAMVGQTVLYVINWKNIIVTNNYAAVRGTACTSPNFSNFKEKGLAQNLGYEYVGTMVLLGIILAFGRGSNATSLTVLGPLPVTFLVMSIGMSLGSVTGYAINPARDFGPRLVYFIFNKLFWKSEVDADWEYSFVPVLAPLAASTTMGLLALI